MSGSQIPPTWETCVLSDVGEINSGGTPSTKNPEFWGDEIPWISPSDLTGYKTKYISRGAKSLSKKGLGKSSAKLLAAGSIHFSSRAPIGYVAISSQSLCTNQGFKSLSPAESVFNEYVYFYLKSIKDLANSLATGTTFKELSGTAFAKLPFPLPPLAEQKRIVSKIEELFSELDAGEESLRRARRQLGVYRQSLLKQAFEGKLTAPWRKQNPDLLESPDQLLNRIHAERQARYEERIKEWKKSLKAWDSGKLKGKKPIKPREAEIVPLTKDAISALPELPAPWIWTSLSELSDHIVDGTHKTPKYVEQGVQFISAKDINDFTISFANTKYITAEEHEELWRRCRPSEGDILLTKSGTIGRVAVVKTDHEFSVFESVAVIPIARSLEPQFFAFQIYCTVQGSFGAANQKGVGVRHLHLEDIRKLPTSLPSLPEQKEIVRLLDEQFTVIEQNERELDAALKRSAALRQSILKKAFTGQLVPQDPTDEPASALLERIRGERENAAKQPKKITRKRSLKS